MTTPSAGRIVNVGGVPIIFGNWFASADEAGEWLSFDADSESREWHAYHDPDHFAEWERWRANRA